MPRTEEHRIEDIAVNIVKINLARAGSLFRDLSGRDYGIDGVIELFEEGEVTGKFFLVQIKGSESKYNRDTNSVIVPCQVRKTTFEYAERTYIPIILVAVNVEHGYFYYDLFSNLHVVDRSVEYPSVHIPKANFCEQDSDSFVEWLKEFNFEEYLHSLIQ